ncbi:S-layer homology domain-containing protein [Paenibacillus nanensis]|uniref:S-layer homology domain-containing protein n=1 Tax=Paenibacillus nanensis TaxID=393251 RepID=A0A3A1VJ83_9BACL|nr:S-layer homology domain-containing protein [Paenibacillus nanensis]RIX60315.1 S-layer homology domain-containing protein [Paenibacillus nanensis]
MITNMIKKPKRLLPLLLAAVLTLSAFGAGAKQASAAAVTASPASPVSHYDYFKDAYPSLANADSHVFKTVTYEDLVRLFESQGTFAILIGGAWSNETQADIGYINEVAKQYGVTTIYNFDTKLDGKDVEIADSANKYSHYYVDLVNKYLPNLSTIYDKTDGDPAHLVSYSANGTPVVASKLQAPFLFVYDKDHKAEDGVTPAPVIASLEKHGASESLSYDASYFANSTLIDSYKTKVQNVLSQVPATEYDTLTNWEFIGDAFNQTFWSENPTYNPNIADGNKKVTIFTQGVDNYDVFEHVTYDQLIRLLQTNGNYVILFGGSWCPNTQADIRFIANQAKLKGIDKIYFFDTKLTAGIDVAKTTHPHGNEELQIRTNNHDLAYLYGDLVSTYLTNIKTQNKSAATPAVISYTKEGVSYTADRLQVPYLFAYNKENKDADGAAAPILGHIELMYSWTGAASNVDPAYVFGDGIADGFNNAALLKGLDALYSRLEAVPTGLAAVNASTNRSNDGQITGIKNKALEYKKANEPDTAYRSADSSLDAITGLPAGAYKIRYKAKPGYQGPVTASGKPRTPAEVLYNAGQSVDIVIAATTTVQDPPPVSSGPWPTTPPKVEDAVTTTPAAGNTDILKAKASSETDETTGETLATLPKETLTSLLSKAKESEKAGKSAVIEIEVETAEKTHLAQLTIPKLSFDEITADTDAELSISYAGLGTVTLNAAALQAISTADSTGDVSIIIAKSELTPEGQEILGDRPVYDFTVFVGDEQVSSFNGGRADVSIPYELKAGEKAEAIIVYYVNDEGGLETIRGQYDASSESVNFGTPHFSQYIIGYNAVAFDDVPDSAWFSKAVGYLAARGITTGTGGSSFSPEAPLTRGQFIVLLLNAYGIEEEISGADNFADAGNTYYTGYLAAAKKLGIATGIGDNRFAPEQTLSRQELFTLLYRSLKALEELPSEQTNAAIDSYSDAAHVSPFAQEAVQAFVESGVIAGSNGKLDPLGVTTRAHAAQILYNVLSKN